MRSVTCDAGRQQPVRCSLRSGLPSCSMCPSIAPGHKFQVLHADTGQVHFCSLSLVHHVPGTGQHIRVVRVTDVRAHGRFSGYNDLETVTGW